jgi:hypothetical protein
MIVTFCAVYSSALKIKIADSSETTQMTVLSFLVRFDIYVEGNR